MRTKLLLAVAISAGCTASDRSPNRDETRFRLIQLSNVAVALGSRATKHTSVPSLLHYALKEGIVVEGDDQKLTKDRWGRPFTLKVHSTKEGDMVITFISAGENGVLEDGEGDDLFSQVTFRQDREPEVQRN